MFMIENSRTPVVDALYRKYMLLLWNRSKAVNQVIKLTVAYMDVLPIYKTGWDLPKIPPNITKYLNRTLMYLTYV